jgi:hypothetical protein
MSEDPMVEPAGDDQPVDEGFDPEAEQVKIDAANSALAWLRQLEQVIANRGNVPPVETLAQLADLIAQARAYLAPFADEAQTPVAEGQASSRAEAFGGEGEG